MVRRVEAERQAACWACRGMEGLLVSLLAEAFSQA